MTGRRQLTVVAGALAVLVALVFTGKHYLRRELFPIAVGSTAPDFSAVTLDSVPRTLRGADYRGQVVLLNIWATWCAPCRVEMPSIEKLHREFGPRGLRILAVSIDDPGSEAQVRDFVKQYGLTFQILHDPKGAVSETYEVTGYPETFVYGRDGIIRRKVVGAINWSSPADTALVARLLAEHSAE